MIVIRNIQRESGINRLYKETLAARSSSVSPEGDLVSSSPVLFLRRSHVVVSVTSNSESSVSLSDGGETSVLSVFVLGRGDPVDSSVSCDSLVVGVNKDDFVEFEGSVLTSPVGVENSEVAALPANSFFGDASVRSLRLELVNSLVNRLSVNNTLADRSLSATSSYSDPVEDKSLLSLVAELSCLVRSG